MRSAARHGVAGGAANNGNEDSNEQREVFGDFESKFEELVFDARR